MLATFPPEKPDKAQRDIRFSRQIHRNLPDLVRILDSASQKTHVRPATSLVNFQLDQILCFIFLIKKIFTDEQRRP